jgi:hypothetical protein
VIVFVRKFRLIFLYRLDELRGHPVTFRIHVQFDELQILIDSFAVVAANSILWLQNAGISDHFFGDRNKDVFENPVVLTCFSPKISVRCVQGWV